MPKVNVYLPDELAEQVKRLAIPVSATCQQALTQEVHKMEALTTATTDIEATAERLRGTIQEEDSQHRQDGREDGNEWARMWATWLELSDLDRWDGDIRPDDDHSLNEFIQDRDYHDIEFSTWEPYWQGFLEGAVEVRETVRPLL